MSEGSARWHASVFYRTAGEPVEVNHDFEELVELHNLIEHGPNFYAIDRIEIRHGSRIPSMTLDHPDAGVCMGGGG